MSQPSLGGREGGPAATHFTIGQVDLSDAVSSFTVHEVINDLPTATVVIESHAILQTPPEYRAEAHLVVTHMGEEVPIFTGLVDRVLPGPTVTEILLVATMIHLQETHIAEMGIGVGFPFAEVVWSILRSAGVPADRIAIEGFAPGDPEVFVVVAPVSGLDVDLPIRAAGVTFFRAQTRQVVEAGLGPPTLTTDFGTTGLFARALVQSTTVYDAETSGLEAIDHALAWLTCASRYSVGVSPARSVRAFDRRWALASPARTDMALTRGIASGRRWIRRLSQIPFQPDLPREALSQPGMPRGGSPMHPQIAQALSSLRRAVQTTDPIQRGVALSEAVEFYVAGTSTTPMLTKQDLDQLRALVHGWPEEKRNYAKQRIGQFNDSPLMKRFLVAVAQDRVPRVRGDIEALKRVRAARNDFVHGRSSDPPEEADLREATAFVGRVLVCRVHRLERRAELEGSLSVNSLLETSAFDFPADT